MALEITMTHITMNNNNIIILFPLDIDMCKNGVSFCESLLYWANLESHNVVALVIHVLFCY